MPGAATHDLAGVEERDLPLRPESVSCSPGGSRSGHSGTKTSRRSHRPLPLLRQDPAQGHKEPKEQEKQADSSSGVLPGHSPSACSVPPRFSLVVQGFSPGPQSLHKKCLQKPVSRNSNWGLTKGGDPNRPCLSSQSSDRDASWAPKVRPGGKIHSHDNLVFRSCPSCVHATCRSAMPGIRSFMARLSRTSCSLPRKRTSP